MGAGITPQKPIPNWEPIPMGVKEIAVVNGVKVNGILWLAPGNSLLVSFEGYEQYVVRADIRSLFDLTFSEILDEVWEDVKVKAGIIITPPPPKIITLS